MATAADVQGTEIARIVLGRNSVIWIWTSGAFITEYVVSIPVGKGHNIAGLELERPTILQLEHCSAVQRKMVDSRCGAERAGGGDSIGVGRGKTQGRENAAGEVDCAAET